MYFFMLSQFKIKKIARGIFKKFLINFSLVIIYGKLPLNLYQKIVCAVLHAYPPKMEKTMKVSNHVIMVIFIWYVLYFLLTNFLYHIHIYYLPFLTECVLFKNECASSVFPLKKEDMWKTLVLFIKYRII